MTTTNETSSSPASCAAEEEEEEEEEVEEEEEDELELATTSGHCAVFLFCSMVDSYRDVVLLI